MNIYLIWVEFVLIFFVLLYTANLATDHTIIVGRALKLSEVFIGAVLVALGTSLPELFVSFNSARVQEWEIVLGNVFGSNFCNLLLVMGFSLLFLSSRKKVDKDSMRLMFKLLLFSAALYVLYFLKALPLAVTVIFLVCCVLGYFFMIAREYKHSLNSSEALTSEVLGKKLLFKHSFLACIGFFAVQTSAHYLIRSAVKISDYYSVNVYFVSFFLVALGTSLPELVTSIVMARKGRYKVILGNLIGSNVFNIAVAFNVSAFLGVAAFQKHLDLSLISLNFMVTVGLLFVFKSLSLSRALGFVLLLSYGALSMFVFKGAL